eukprot:TRINITY_DN624_c0_g1_i1.p1 TRINITY_DN624_c0_g1~~TRINITY_DN624_c0_g1_i1.p1  ORF type:complete len:339 (+),score=56.53 TRINITY_DN624_c0_g1_i1:32-1018(+)
MSAEWVTLNVGGRIFLTTRQTLEREPNSLFTDLFREGSSPPRDQSGAYLFDADPKYFEPLLNYLRRGQIVVEDGLSIHGVLTEARHFGLQSMIEQLEDSIHPGKRSDDAGLTWEDIGGLAGVKKELLQVVENSVKFRDRFERWGLVPTKNVLLYGPPGCGKTLLARVTANEIRANFLLVKCPELLGELDGAAAKIQDKLNLARLLQPCVLFLEEFECIARVRGSGEVGRDGLISQLAISLDMVSASRDNVFVFAATNRPEILEPALLRPGRFDQLIYIPLPDRAARLGILRATLRKSPLGADVDLSYLAHHTHGLSGADMKEICQRVK